jgi:hypothetical protein
VDSGSGARFSSAIAILALVYKDSTNFQAARRRRGVAAVGVTLVGGTGDQLQEKS